ncbi:hypothetical protein [Azospirillum argentinense]
MPSDASIEEKYEKAMRDAVSLNPVFPHQAKMQMAVLIEEVSRSDGNLQQFLRHGTSAAQRAGFVAEEFHATTFNMDSIVKGSSLRAETGMDNHLIGNNDKVSDVVIARNGSIEVRAQSKYMADAGTTANKHASLDQSTLAPKYEGADVALSPSDQMEAIRKRALERALSHEGKAQAFAREGSDPLVARAHQAKADAYRQAAQKASATLEHDGVSSTPLSKVEAERLGDGDIAKLDDLRSQYKTQSTVRQMGHAAAGAAAMAAVVAGTVNTVRYLDLVRKGRMSGADATIKIIGETAAAAADSAIKAGMITGAHSTLARLSGQRAVATLAQQGLSTMVRTNAVSAGVVCAVNAVKDLVLLAKGDITADEFYERQGKGILNTSAGMMGSTLGVAAMPAAGTVALAPLIGALAGGLVATVAMNFAIEVGIEAPYRELVGNTTALKGSAQLLEEISQAVFGGQVHFSAFLELDGRLERALQAALADGATQTSNMATAIDRI